MKRYALPFGLYVAALALNFAPRGLVLPYGLEQFDLLVALYGAASLIWIVCAVSLADRGRWHLLILWVPFAIPLALIVWAYVAWLTDDTAAMALVITIPIAATALVACVIGYTAGVFRAERAEERRSAVNQ